MRGCQIRVFYNKKKFTVLRYNFQINKNLESIDMLKSKAFLGLTVVFALYSFFITYSGFFSASIKLPQNSQTNLLNQTETQWFERKGKVVMILVDALRWDFLLNINMSESNKLYPDHKFKKLSNLVAYNSTNIVVMRARADPPTMTVNRIPCIATGNIPPVAALLDAFDASRAVEDSFPRQLRLLKRKSYFTGDPLWIDYFPDDWTEAKSSVGMNIKDTEVDKGAISWMKEKIQENNFDFLLGHLLSVDHMGHAHGKISDEVKKQIAATDQAIMEIIDIIDYNTTLVILGDHGMDDQGTHGGGTPDEMNTAIIAYHKKGFLKYQQNQAGLSQVMRSINETVLSVKQQDVTPTFAMLLGVPIPFSNMGQIINDIYPAVKINEECLEMQVLHDNYLNSLQILNYFNSLQQKSHLISEEKMKEIQSLAQEVGDLYNKTVNMSQQCESASFREAVISTILKTQNLSEQVYQTIRSTGSFDMLLIHEGLALLVLVIFLYILIMQYLYRKGHNEKSIFGIFELRAIDGFLKKSIPILVLTLLATVATFYLTRRFIHALTTAVLCVALWFCGEFIISLMKNMEEKESSCDYESNNAESLMSPKENKPLLQSNLLFLFQSPLFSVAALTIIVYCFITVQLGNFSSMFRTSVKPTAPFTLILVTGYRLHRLWPQKFNPALPLAALVCGVLYFKDVVFSSELSIILGFLLLLDFIWGEIKYIMNELGTSKLWGVAYIACFGLLAVFHLVENRTNYWIEIAIPRLIWALLIGTIVLRFTFPTERKSIIVKRNLQLCLVLYLALLTKPQVILYFAVLLIAMRVVNHLYKNVSPLNYTYPAIMALLNQFGLHFLGHNDRDIPKEFDVGFVGLHDFNMVLSSLMVFLNMFASYFIGFVLVSHYNQSLDVAVVKESEEKKLSEEHAQVVKKRNVLPFLITFSLIYLGGVIKCYVWKYYRLEEAAEKFAVDSVIYFVAMFGGVCLF